MEREKRKMNVLELFVANLRNGSEFTARATLKEAAAMSVQKEKKLL